MTGSVLTARELAVLQALVDGLTSKGIGRRLAITEATVKIHRKALLRKLGSMTTAQAVAVAIRRGIIT